MSRISIAIALVALAMSVTVVFRGFREGDPSNDKILQEELGRLSHELKMLSDRARVSSALPRFELRTLDGATPNNQAAEIESALNHLSQRLGVLEQRVMEWQSSVGGPARTRRNPPSAEEIAAAEALAIDTSKAPELRVAALQTLRFANKRTPEVAGSLVELLQSSHADPSVKVGIVRHLAGVDYPELKKPFLDILASSQEESLKAEAVEALIPFYGEPEVMAAVTKARDTDVADKVRKEADRRLAQWRSRQSSR
jgi:hypothetical protein